MLSYQDIASRVSTRNDRTRHERSQNRGSAIVGSYIERDRKTGLAKYGTVDGGVGYVRKISPAVINRGERIPALVSGSISNFGFGDNRY